MIRALIVKIDLRARAEGLPLRAFNGLNGNFLEQYAGIRVGNETSYGFVDVEQAKAVREELARRNPGHLYALFEFTSAVECPPGEVQHKRLNDIGELVNGQ